MFLVPVDVLTESLPRVTMSRLRKLCSRQKNQLTHAAFAVFFEIPFCFYPCLLS